MTGVALVALTVMVPGMGAIPLLQGRLPAPDVATWPGVTVMVHEAPAAKVLVQVVV